MSNPIFKKHVFVCVTGKTCNAQGSEEIFQCLKQEVANLGMHKQIRINKSGCLAQCGNGPMLVVYPEATWYGHIQNSDLKEIAYCHLLNDKPIKRLLYDGNQVNLQGIDTEEKL